MLTLPIGASTAEDEAWAALSLSERLLTSPWLAPEAVAALRESETLRASCVARLEQPLIPAWAQWRVEQEARCRCLLCARVLTCL